MSVVLAAGSRAGFVTLFAAACVEETRLPVREKYAPIKLNNAVSLNSLDSFVHRSGPLPDGRGFNPGRGCAAFFR
jgi:hypothetical protein